MAMEPIQSSKPEPGVELHSLSVRDHASTSRLLRGLRQLRWGLRTKSIWLSELPKRVAKYFASFTKKDWQLSDYPLRFVRQDGWPGQDTEWREQCPRWRVDVLGWLGVSGIGHTREEAYADLEHQFAEKKTKAEALPRPGTFVPFHLKFAESERIEKYTDLLVPFMQSMVGLDPGDYVVTDESSLLDFDLRQGREQWRAKISEVYKVNVSGIEDLNIVRILEKIRGVRSQK